jgi:aspartate/methionine/tyrosine aminotransferase
VLPVKPFKLERYFAQYEFTAEYMLSSSDAEPLTKAELLAHASDAHRALWNDLWLGYTESQGHPLLLEAVAALYGGIAPGDVIEVVPEEGIFIAMHALLNAGDHVVVTYPAYQSLYQIAESLGCAVSHWLPDPDGWRFDVDDLAALIRPETRLIVINFPHNPTGALLSGDAFAAVIELARRHGCLLFSDEMYRWSEHDAADRLPAACEVYEDAVSLSGLSKSFGLPGLRTGWLVTRRPDLMSRFVRFKDYTTICGSAPGEILALIALSAKDRLIARTRTVVRDNLSVLADFFSRHAEVFGWHPPRAGTVTLAEFRGSTPIDTFAEKLVTEKGVMLVPASQFDYEGPYFRLGFGRRSLPDALARLEEFLTG